MGYAFNAPSGYAPEERQQQGPTLQDVVNGSLQQEIQSGRMNFHTAMHRMEEFGRERGASEEVLRQVRSFGGRIGGAAQGRQFDANMDRRTGGTFNGQELLNMNLAEMYHDGEAGIAQVEADVRFVLGHELQHRYHNDHKALKTVDGTVRLGNKSMSIRGFTEGGNVSVTGKEATGAGRFRVSSEYSQFADDFNAAVGNSRHTRSAVLAALTARDLTKIDDRTAGQQENDSRDAVGAGANAEWN